MPPRQRDDKALRERRSMDGPRRLSDAERGGGGGRLGDCDYELRDRRHSFKTARDGRRRSSDPSKDDTDEVVFYEGPSGPRTGRMFHETTIMVTDWSVEVEREGAHPVLSILTLGLWYWLFQTISTEVFELERVTELELRGGVIHGSYAHSVCCHGGSFRLDTPAGHAKSTRALFRDLKDAWNIARVDVADSEQREAEAQSLLANEPEV
jgi:hypothetical protein